MTPPLRSLIAALLAPLALMYPAAAGAETGPSPTASLAAPVPGDVSVVLTADNAGQTIAVPLERRFAVALVGVPTAGYVWRVRAMPAFLTRAGEASGPTIQAQRQAGFAGGQHWEVEMFVALEAGEGDLWLVQQRPWETDEPPVDAFHVRIVAQ